MITDECINCGACEPECPNTAIYEGGMEWTWAGGTGLQEVELEDGTLVLATEPQPPVADDIYYIVSGKCTERDRGRVIGKKRMVAPELKVAA